MTRFQRWFLYGSTIATAVSGITYFAMKHFLEPSDPWAVINHPLEPWALKAHILSVHIHDLPDYPYRELFHLLKGIGYDRYTLVESPSSCEPERFLKFYQALWSELLRSA